MNWYTVAVAALTAAAAVAVWRWWARCWPACQLRKAWRKIHPHRRRMPRWKRRAVYVLALGRCASCGERVNWTWKGRPLDLEVDHVVPWSWGGSDGLPNLQALCKADNGSKGATRIGT